MQKYNNYNNQHEIQGSVFSAKGGNERMRKQGSTGRLQEGVRKGGRERY